MPNQFFSAAILSVALAFSSTVLADDAMTVDQADSLDFSEFHEKDSTNIHFGSNKQKREGQVNFEKEATEAAGERFTRTTYMARTRFTLQAESKKTPYTALTVINAQAQQMAQTCPNGWIKIKEWNTPVEADFYNQVEFACLD